MNGMRGRLQGRWWVLLVALAGAQVLAQPVYPPSRTVDAGDTYFNRTYRDPYRWLENLKDPEVEAWFKDQAGLTDATLARLPGRDALVKAWLALDTLTPPVYRNVSVEAGRVFYKKTLGGENVGKLYLRQSWKGAERLLFDPTVYKPGVVTTIEAALPSWDGKWVVLGLSAQGAEYSELRVLDVARGTLLPDSIGPSYGPYGWLPDGRSFLYDIGKTSDLKSLEVELHRTTRVHVIGTAVAADREVLSDAANPELGLAPKDIPWAAIDELEPGWVQAGASTVQQELLTYLAPVAELRKAKVAWQPLSARSDALVRGMALFGDQAYAVTHAGAPRYRLVRTPARQPDWAHAETVLPEARDSIQSMARSRNFLLVVYSDGILGRLVKYEPRRGKASEVKLPIPGTVDITCPDAHSDTCLVTVTGWTTPPRVYELDAARGTLGKSVLDAPVTYPGFDQLVSEELEVEGHDGTRVPLSIIRRKDLVLDGNHSALLFGYGAYGVSSTPSFNFRVGSLALRGAVIAYSHPRGGGERGEAWYKGGYKATKPNTWKDYLACAEFLVKEGYTRPGRLAGSGTSAGGILISRAITERPDLFAAAVCNVGCANAMRMEFSPNGPVNTPEFGTVADEAEARALFEMDGVQHVEAGVRYPAVLGVAGWNDPRVAPWEPGKFVAALQAASSSGKPVLLQVNYDNGHFTEEKLVTFRNFASQYAFLMWQTGHPDFQPSP